jgi:cytochrome P450
VKDVLIRKFKNFHDNEFCDLIDPKKDPLFARNPFFLKGQEWKDKRAEITPAFTVNRIKVLFPLIQDVIEKMKVYVNQQSEKGDPFDARELAAKFTTDVVSNVVYGLDAESFTKEKPQIREMGRDIFAFTSFTFFKTILVSSVPFLKNYIEIRFSKDGVQDFFKDLMIQAINYRKENNVQREDFLDYVIQLREKKHISDLDLASHTISFFSDGFETSSIAIAGVLYEVNLID